MATPKKTAVTSNQRESRVSTPAVVAKSTPTANQRETRVVTPVKSSGDKGGFQLDVQDKSANNTNSHSMLRFTDSSGRNWNSGRATELWLG